MDPQPCRQQAGVLETSVQRPSTSVNSTPPSQAQCSTPSVPTDALERNRSLESPQPVEPVIKAHSQGECLQHEPSPGEAVVGAVRDAALNALSSTSQPSQRPEEVALSDRAGSDEARSDVESDSDVEIILATAAVFSADLTFSSLESRGGTADPSMAGHPHSPWYQQYSSPGFQENSPSKTPNLQLVRDDFLAFHKEVIGLHAEAKEDHRVGKMQRRKRPARDLHQDTRLPSGRWSTLTFATAVQAHNLRHWAVTENDMYASRRYRQVVVQYQDDPTLRRVEGVRYLLQTFQTDAPRFPADYDAIGKAAHTGRAKRPVGKWGPTGDALP